MYDAAFGDEIILIKSSILLLCKPIKKESEERAVDLVIIIMIFYIADEVEDNETKGFVDLMRIPSMFVFFLALVVIQFANKGQASMQSEWVSETVSCTNGTFHFHLVILSSQSLNTSPKHNI